MPRLLLRYWKYAAGALVLVAAFWALHSYGQSRYKEGKAVIQAAWDKDRAARAAVDASIAKDQELKDAANRARNEVIEREYKADLAAIAADRDSLAGRLRERENRLRSLASASATDKQGLIVAARIAASAAETDRLYDEYDQSCRRDAVRFKALQDEVRPLL